MTENRLTQFISRFSGFLLRILKFRPVFGRLSASSDKIRRHRLDFGKISALLLNKI